MVWRAARGAVRERAFPSRVQATGNHRPLLDGRIAGEALLGLYMHTAGSAAFDRPWLTYTTIPKPTTGATGIPALAAVSGIALSPSTNPPAHPNAAPADEPLPAPGVRHLLRRLRRGPAARRGFPPLLLATAVGRAPVHVGLPIHNH